MTADRALGDFVNLTATAPADVLAYLLCEASEAMQHVLGEHIAPDAILTTVFGTFCIGK
jgi:tRNA U34 5-carboxymethylaminomethyl modifying GTPase MnmE/TrmE